MNLNLFNNNEFSKCTKVAYQNSIIPEILADLRQNFKGIKKLTNQLECLTYLLFLKSLLNNNGLNDLSLHMAFSGKTGTGKSSIALKIAQILRDLTYLSKGHLTSVTREDLVGQYVGHTAPKTREILKKSQGGILFIDQSHELYKSNNEKDYGAEAIEIILQIMESQRKDLVLIFSDEKEKLDSFFKFNPGISSRIGSHIYFEDYSLESLMEILISLLNKEGGFFFEEEAFSLVDSYLRKFLNSSNFSNIRTIELFIHQILIYHNEKVYNNSLSKDLYLNSFLKIEKNELLNLSKKELQNIIGQEEANLN